MLFLQDSWIQHVLNAMNIVGGSLGFLTSNIGGFPRVCVIELENLGNRELEKPTLYMSHGVILQHLPLSLAPNATGKFTFEKRSYATHGTSGVLTYTISGTTHQVAVYWSVPFRHGIGNYSNTFHVQVWNNVQANEALFKRMAADEKKVANLNSGHWYTCRYSGYGIKVKAFMTNTARASLLVKAKFNIP